MANKSIRIILDTNLWISFLISNNFSILTQLIISHNIQLLFSLELIEEFLDVVSRPKLKKYFSDTNLKTIMTHIHSYAEFIEVTAVVSECRDMKDNFLLALAQDGKADYLLTGDKDLLVLNAYKETKITTISDFYTIILQIT